MGGSERGLSHCKKLTDFVQLFPDFSAHINNTNVSGLATVSVKWARWQFPFFYGVFT